MDGTDANESKLTARVHVVLPHWNAFTRVASQIDGAGRPRIHSVVHLPLPDL